MKRKDWDSKDCYSGVFEGVSVHFDRMFRGHRFSDEECRALFDGKRVEVHNIQGSRGRYAVQGCLRKEHVRLLSGAYDTVCFAVLDLVPNRPDFRFGMPLYGEDTVSDVPKGEDDGDLEGFVLDETFDHSAEEKKLSVPEIPSFRSSLFSILAGNAAFATETEAGRQAATPFPLADESNAEPESNQEALNQDEPEMLVRDAEAEPVLPEEPQLPEEQKSEETVPDAADATVQMESGLQEQEEPDRVSEEFLESGPSESSVSEILLRSLEEGGSYWTGAEDIESFSLSDDMNPELPDVEEGYGPLENDDDDDTRDTFVSVVRR